MKNYLIAFAVTVLQMLMIVGALWLIEGEKPRDLTVICSIAIAALLSANQSLLRKGAA